MSRIVMLLRGCFPKSAFARGISVLAGGTALSQLISIAALPFLTRIYSPNDFSTFAVYTSILALITVVACLRFEVAIPIPQEKRKANELLALSLLSVAAVTVLVSCLVLFFSEQINLLTKSKLKEYLWIIPVGGMLGGIYSAFQYWATRERSFSLISKTRIAQAISGSGTQVGLGCIGLTPFGLLLGQLFNVGTGIFSLVNNYHKKSGLSFKELKIKNLKTTFREYDRFVKYSTFEALSNSAAIQVPVLLIASYAAGAEVGFIMLAMRLLSAPVSLIGKAVSQVYLSEAPEYFRKGQLNKFTRKAILDLTKLGGPPLLFAAVSAPFLVPIVFGSEWQRAGILISWMVPWFFLQFVSSPVSMSLHITGNQRIALVLQVFGLAFRAGLVLLAGMSFSSYMAETYALTGLVFYALYMFVIFSILRKH